MTGTLSLESLKRDISSLLSGTSKKTTTKKSTKKSTTKKSTTKKSTKKSTTKKSKKQTGGWGGASSSKLLEDDY